MLSACCPMFELQVDPPILVRFTPYIMRSITIISVTVIVTENEVGDCYILIYNILTASTFRALCCTEIETTKKKKKSCPITQIYGCLIYHPQTTWILACTKGGIITL